MIALLKILPFIKSNYKLIAFIILIVMVIYLFLHGRAEKERADQAEQGRDAAIQISNGLTSLSHKYKNKQGDTVVVTKVIGIPQSQVNDLLKEKELQWLKKFEGLKKDDSNLQSASSFSSEFDFNVVPEKVVKIPCKDSLKAFSFDVHDKYNDIHAIVIDTPRIEIRDHYYSIIELKRPKGWLLKFQWSKREVIGEITNANKLINIDSVAVFVIKR